MRVTGRLTCRELTERLADYCGGRLGCAERWAVGADVANCPGCIAYLRGYAKTMRLAREAYR